MCPRGDVVTAYVDGELSAEQSERLERHIADCPACGRLLREQRQFLAALTATLDVERSVELPADFAQKVVSNAESRVTGIRHGREFLVTAAICAAVVITAAVFLGGEAGAVGTAAAAIAEKFFAVAWMVVRPIANFAFAVAVIVRSLASHLGGTGFALTAGLLAAAAIAAVSTRRVYGRRSA